MIINQNKCLKILIRTPLSIFEIFFQISEIQEKNIFVRTNFGWHVVM